MESTFAKAEDKISFSQHPVQESGLVSTYCFMVCKQIGADSVSCTVQGLNWNSYHIDDAVAVCLKATKALADIQAAVKGHMYQIQALLKSWISKIIVERRPNQVNDLLLSLSSPQAPPCVAIRQKSFLRECIMLSRISDIAFTAIIAYGYAPHKFCRQAGSGPLGLQLHY